MKLSQIELNLLEDHPWYRFEPEGLSIDQVLGYKNFNNPLIVKKSDSSPNFVIISGHIRKRLSLLLRKESVLAIVLEPSSLMEEIEIMKRENRDQWNKKEKLNFIFNHFGEEFSKQNRLGKLNEGKETKEVGVLIERASLGRIPRGTASRLIADRRREMMSGDQDEIVPLPRKKISENLLITKEARIDPLLVGNLEKKIATLSDSSQSERIIKTKLNILVRELLVISAHVYEKEQILNQIKSLKKRKEAKQSIISKQITEIQEFFGESAKEHLSKLGNEANSEIQSLFGDMSTIFKNKEVETLLKEFSK